MPIHVLWIAALLVGLIIVGGIVLLIVWAVGQGASRTPHNPSSPAEPLDILARRFAAGEITAEDYQRARVLLGGGEQRLRT